MNAMTEEIAIAIAHEFGEPKIPLKLPYGQSAIGIKTNDPAQVVECAVLIHGIKGARIKLCNDHAWDYMVYWPNPN